MSRLTFEPFELDLAGGELRRAGVVLKLQPQPLKVLTLLAESGGRLVSREEIRKEVWREETFVDFDQGLNYCIRQIRATLSDDADAPRFIETVPRRGYRFVAPVRRTAGEPTGVSRRVMLAVPPYTNLSGDDDQEYFSDGLTDEMIAQLGRLNPARLGVIARTSVMTYKRATKPVDVIGRELGVEYALEGSVRRSGSQVRVTAQLIQVSDQTQRWTGSFDRHVGDMLTLQTDLARAIASEIRVQLTPEAHVRVAATERVDADAYDAYLRGRYLWNRRTREALDKSIGQFNKALEIDAGCGPSGPPCRAGLKACTTWERHDESRAGPGARFDGIDVRKYVIPCRSISRAASLKKVVSRLFPVCNKVKRAAGNPGRVAVI